MRPLSASVYYSLTKSYFKVPGKVVNNDGVGYRASRASTHIKAYMCYKMVSISKGCFYMVQQPGSLSLGFTMPMLCTNHLPHQVKKERHYKVYTRTSA